MRSAVLSIGLALVLVPLEPARGQESEWNGAEALALVRAAREARRSPARSPRGTTYVARADGHVYFYLDREDGAPPVPLRVDQLSLDVELSPPGPTRQVLRATRGQDFLPLRELRYYSDRFRLAEGTYSDRIQVGDGRDVRGVPHPLSEGPTDLYDFRLGPTVVLQGAGAEPRRITELMVRPRDPNSAAFVGSIHIDESTGGVVRMDFTFTDASYVDARNDYVRVGLEFMLWGEALWLPRAQTIEVRRESTVIDLPLGTVIRSRIQVSGYVQLDAATNATAERPMVRVADPAAADSTRFRGGLLDGLADEGLDGSWQLPDLGWRDLRKLASSGGSGVRLHADRLSSIVRMTRAEGVRLGAGLTASLAGRRVDLLAGYAIGARQASVAMALSGVEGLRPRLRVGWQELGDAGWPRSGYGVFGSLGMLTSAEDRLDPYFVTGVRAGLSPGSGPTSWTVEAWVEEHEAAELVWPESPLLDVAARPVRPAAPGTEVAVQFGVTRGWTLGEGHLVRQEGTAQVGAWSGRAFGEVRSSWLVQLPGALGAHAFEGRLDVAARLGETPEQRLYFVGGLNTLPGHPWRRWAGARVALFTARLTRELVGPALGAEAFGAVGVTGGSGPVSEAWDVEVGGRPRGSVGVGLTAFEGILRLRVARGLHGGEGTVYIVLEPTMRRIF